MPETSCALCQSWVRTGTSPAMSENECHVIGAPRQRFGDPGLIERTGTIGHHSVLAMTMNACELPARPGAEVLKP